MADEQTMTDLKDLAGAVEGTVAPATPAAPLREKIVDKQGRAYATGRRKDAVARVWVKPGTGKITVNGRDQEVYFARPTLRLVINQPFGVADRVGALSGYFMAVFASMSVERTARGDEMFAVMAERPARQALMLGSLDLL